jgi:hypothetical protein
MIGDWAASQWGDDLIGMSTLIPKLGANGNMQ